LTAHAICWQLSLEKEKKKGKIGSEWSAGHPHTTALAVKARLPFGRYHVRREK
jgi:hypothetical protein